MAHRPSLLARLLPFRAETGLAFSLLSVFSVTALPLV